MIKKTVIVLILVCLVAVTLYSEEAIIKMWRSDPQRTGVYQTKALTTLTGIKWQFKSKEKDDRFISGWNSFAYIYKGILYTQSNAYFDAVTGKEYLWKDLPYRTSHYMIILNNIGLQGSYYQWNIDTKELIIDDESLDHGELLLHNNILFYLSYREDPYILTIYADDFATGKRLWEAEERADTIFFFPSSIAAKDNVLIVPFTDMVLAYDTKTGKQLWKQKVKGTIEGGAVIGDTTVYISANGVYAFNLTTGKLLWENKAVKPIGGVGVNTLALYKNIVLASDWDKLRGIDGKTGKVIWEYLFPDGSSEMSSTVIAENVCYIGHGNTMYAINCDTGALQWKFDTKNRIHFTPLIEDGVLYFGNDGGEFFALH